MTRKVLLVGDPHVTHDDLQDCQALFDIIKEAVKKHQVTDVFFMGDMHHRHNSVRTEELSFVKQNLDDLADNYKTTVHLLLGNHDMPTSCQSEHNSIWPYKSKNIRIYDNPTYITDISNDWNTAIFAIPYCHTNEEWDNQINQIPHKKAIVFAHQSFLGFTYENGYPIKDGLTVPDHIQVYSGHIHSPQSINNIFYTGAPRWKTLGDAEVKQRYLYIMENGQITNKIPTYNQNQTSVRRIRREFYQYPDSPTIETNQNEVLYLEITGPKEWLKGECQKWPKAKITTKTQVNINQIEVKASLGVPTVFQDFMQAQLQKPNYPSKDWVNQQLQVLQLNQI